MIFSFVIPGHFDRYDITFLCVMGLALVAVFLVPIVAACLSKPRR